jgi:hypothetical protein
MNFVILVTGDRNWSNTDEGQKISVWYALRGYRKHNPIIVHGAARGVDTMAGDWAARLGYVVHPHPADWDKYHRAAGPIRNQEMLAENPNLVLAFHDDIGNSKGTKDMVNRAVKRGIPTILHKSDGTRTVVTKPI